MYGKYTLFYESPKNWGYNVDAQTVCTRPLLGGGRGLGTRLGAIVLGQYINIPIYWSSYLSDTYIDTAHLCIDIPLYRNY